MEVLGLWFRKDREKAVSENSQPYLLPFQSSHAFRGAFGRGQIQEELTGAIRKTDERKGTEERVEEGEREAGFYGTKER